MKTKSAGALAIVCLAWGVTAAHERSSDSPEPRFARITSPRYGARLPASMANVSPHQGGSQAAVDVRLTTASTIIALDRQTGGLTHLIHRASGQEFVSAEVPRPLFAFTLTKPYEAKKTDISAADFQKVEVSERVPNMLELTFAEHASMPLSVRVSASTDAEGLVRLRIVVNNKSDWAVSRVQFPQFAAPASLGKSAADDRLIAPWSDTLLMEAPGNQTQSRTALYPVSACIQFEALYDPTAGLYMATYDANGHYKQWGVSTASGRFVAMPLAHLVPEIPGKDVALPYDVVLGTFAGDWRDAADIYKRWAKQQPWCARKVSQRDAVPNLLRDGSGIFCVPFRHEKLEYALYPFESLAKLPQIASAYRERAQLPHIGFAPFGWENRGAWAGINYFPAVPSDEAWRKVNAALRKQGDYTFMLPSGFSWVVKRGETRSGPAFDDTLDLERRKQMVVQDADGRPWSADYYQDTTSWRGVSVKLCHGSAAARETALKIFLDIARLGTSLVQFDQEIGGGQAVPCYSKTHGHPPGFGNWMWTDFRDLCSRVLKQGKSIRPEFGLSIEGCAELAIPYMATMWGRQGPEVGPGRGVGLFSYLYHEYIPVLGDGYSGGQGLASTWGSAELRCYRLANTLARGLIPTVYMEQVPLEPGDEWLRTVSQAFLSYCRPYGRFREYLLLGTTRRPPKIECAEQNLWYWEGDEQGERLPDGRRARKATIRRPTVVAGSFEAEDGSLGTIIVNATAQPQAATIRLAPSERAVLLLRADRSEEQRWGKCPSEVAVSLEAFGVRVLIER